MGNDNTNRRTVEAEFKKGMARAHVPIGLLVTAFGLGLMVMAGSYLIKYFRGAVPFHEVYGTEQARNEYVSFDINYVLDTFMESYYTRYGVRSRSSVYYLALDEEAGAVPVRVSGKLAKEMDRIMDETWDYLNGIRPEPPRGMHVEGTLKKLKGDGKTYYDRVVRMYDLETEGESYYFWAGMLDNQSPSSSMGTTGLGAVITLLGLFILSSLLKKHHVTAVQTFLDSHNDISREMLDEDFQNARKISSTFWLGEDLSYGIIGKPVILVNRELKKVGFQEKRVGRHTSQELVCIMADGKEYGFTMDLKKANEAIALYQAKFPALKMASGLRGKLMVMEQQADNKQEES